MRVRWKGLLMDGSECNSLISTMMKYPNSCEDKVKSSMCLGIKLKE
jgi:hypothetical protein